MSIGGGGRAIGDGTPVTDPQRLEFGGGRPTVACVVVVGGSSTGAGWCRIRRSERGIRRSSARGLSESQ